MSSPPGRACQNGSRSAKMAVYGRLMDYVSVDSGVIPLPVQGLSDVRVSDTQRSYNMPACPTQEAVIIGRRLGLGPIKGGRGTLSPIRSSPESLISKKDSHRSMSR